MIKLIDFCCQKKSRAQITMSVHECDWQYQPNLFFFIDKTHNKHFYARCHIQYVIVSTHIYNPKGFHTDQSRDIHSQYVLLLLTPICSGSGAPKYWSTRFSVPKANFCIYPKPQYKSNYL